MKKAIVLSLLVLAGAVATVTLNLATRDDGATQAPIEAATDDTPAGDPDPLDAGGASARCVEQYDLDRVARREVAFAGTLESIDGDDATFEVERWYRGGEGDAVTLGGAGVLTGLTSVSEHAFAPGDRVLVSGDGGFAWPCGFTQAYDDAVAADWDDVFADG